jgi:E3 ubiquitin-protein ligase synoviolin
MDAQYPDATEEDVGRLGDRVCIICREEMVVRGGHADTQPGQAEGREGQDGTVEGQGQEEVPVQPAPPPVVDEDGPNETPKKLVCGHVFHFHCLRSWLERQQSCPTWYVLFSYTSLLIFSPSISSSTRPPTLPGSMLTNSRRDVLHTTPTTQQRRPAPPAPAPAPAPGAVPQPPNNVALREQYEEFFRIPQENGAIPTPAPPAPVPTNGITAGPTPAPITTVAAETAEDRIQTSIWGGPIQPGRFFAPPLGSIRRNVQPQPRAGPSRPTPVPIRTTIPIPNYNNDAPRSSFPAPRGYGFNSPVLPSEASTPFSSNPPEVFRSMSSGSDIGGEAESSMEGVVDEGGRGNRRLAAEAAMRRMGLTRPGMKGKEKEKEKSIPEPTPTETTAIAGASKESQETKSMNETYTPYLSPIARAPHPMADRSPWSKRGSLDDKVQSLDIQIPLEREGGRVPFGREGVGRGGMREGVEERLRTLKRVDDTIWGLVEELTRIRSLMDGDHEAEASEGEGTVE